jgi:phosphomannomutase
VINPKIFKAYDIRGIYPTEIDEAVIYAITRAFYAYFSQQLGKKNLQVVVGGDMRLSTPVLSEQVKKALVDSGAEVIDIGLVSTPTFYFAVRHYNYDAGIQISASHNPKDYNGLKSVINTPEGLVKIGKNTGMAEVQKLANEGNFETPASGRGKITKKENVLAEDVANAIDVIKPGEIKPLTVVADAANAMGATYLDALFEKLPCKLIRMNFELDGTFPAHQADPLQFETLKDLQKRVVDEKADLGIAPDGDGDRVFFIDERGGVVPAAITTAIIIRELLKKYPGEKMGFDTRYIWSPLKATKDNGGVAVITQVGHALITETMHKENLFYAGESSGHNYWRFAGGAESSIAVVITLLDTLSKENKKMSEIVKEISASYESGEVNFKLDNSEEARKKLELFKEIFKDGKISTIDGLSVDYPDWRFNLRVSNTEPLIRLNIESKTKELTEEKKSELSKLITSDEQK